MLDVVWRAVLLQWLSKVLGTQCKLE